MASVTVLSSGSRGNSTIVASSKTKILVDAGLSCRELFKRMREIDEVPESLDAIVITHEHQDHVQGVAVTARKLGIPVYFTEMTHRAWMRWMMPQKRLTYADWLEQRRKEKDAKAALEITDAEQVSAEAEPVECVLEEAEQATPSKGDPCALPGVEFFSAGEPFEIGDIAVTPFTIPHDAADPVGFVFVADGVRMAIATDLGYVPANVQQNLKRCDLLMIESNHDLDMLRDGPYPWSVKQRVLSRVGHLSNDATAEFLSKGYDGHAEYLILAHLSESNNLPELARISAEKALRERMSLIKKQLRIASQKEPIPAVHF
jgi:phosphoribosyl 1,2-cyclic phosphodiesterase